MMTNDDDEQNKQYNGLWNLQPTPRTIMEIIIKIKKKQPLSLACLYIYACHFGRQKCNSYFPFQIFIIFSLRFLQFLYFFSLSLFQFLFSFKLFWFDSTIFLFFLFLTCFLPNSRIRIDKMVKKENTQTLPFQNLMKKKYKKIRSQYDDK